MLTGKVFLQENYFLQNIGSYLINHIGPSKYFVKEICLAQIENNDTEFSRNFGKLQCGAPYKGYDYYLEVADKVWTINSGQGLLQGVDGKIFPRRDSMADLYDSSSLQSHWRAGATLRIEDPNTMDFSDSYNLSIGFSAPTILKGWNIDPIQIKLTQVRAELVSILLASKIRNDNELTKNLKIYTLAN